MRIALLLLPAVVLAGCTVEPPEVQRGPGAVPLAPDDPRGDAANASAGFEAPPAWAVRQWWRYRGGNGEETRAVAADAGGAWLVGTTSEAAAYFEARSDISTVGPIRKADLAGAQRGAAVEYYRWPLVANATWSTPWDGATRQVRVLGPSLATIGGASFPAMALEAREGERVAVRYDFVPAAGWFSHADFVDADGTTFGLQLAAFGTGFNGSLVEARLEELYRDAAPGPLKPAGQFAVPAGLAFLDARGLFRGDHVLYDVGFRGPDGFQTGAQVGPCTANCTLAFNATLPATAGTWGLAAVGAVQGTAVPPSAELTVTGVQFQRRAFG